MVIDPVRTIIVPILLLTVIVAISAYLYTEGFANERDPTCPVGFYNSKGVLCSGKNPNKDSTGDLPNSYSGAPDPTCTRGSGTSKKTGGPCTGANTSYTNVTTSTSNTFGNAGGSLIPTTRTVPTTRVLASISESDLSYNPVIPVLDTSGDMYNIYRFISDASDNSISTDASANPILNSILAATAAPVKAAATSTTAATATGLSTDTIKSMIRDEVTGQLASGQGCPVEEECEEEEEEEEGCNSSISMKQGRDALAKRCKPYVATNHIPCWGC
jgi:hypothetical protein